MSHKRVSIHTILLMVTMAVLFLPLGSLHFLRLYENALIRQTESELIAQAAFIGATYKQEISSLLEPKGQNEPYGIPVISPAQPDRSLRPIFAKLDLAVDPVHPPRPSGNMAQRSPDILAIKAGRKITPILQDAQRVTLSGLKVLDYQGVVVAGQRELGLSFGHLPEVRQALKGQHVSLFRRRTLNGQAPPLTSISRGATINVFVAAPITLNNRVIGVALLNRTPMDLVKVLYGKKEDLLFASLLVLIAALSIAALTSVTITRPLHALMNQARRIAAGEKEAIQPIKRPVTREVAMLSDSLSEMAKVLEHRSGYIRDFATNVSHEFKTPLTAIQGSVELLQEHWADMEPGQRERFLDNIRKDTDRLRRLVSRLLELARADLPEPVKASVAILPVLRAIKERYDDIGLPVSIENATGHSEPLAALPQEVLEAALTNLCDNSRQHGAGTIGLTLGNTDSGFELRIRDDGAGISKANREKIFTPFFTTNREQGGTGLGLSITRQLLRTYGADIQLNDSLKGAEFLLILPRQFE